MGTVLNTAENNVLPTNKVAYFLHFPTAEAKVDTWAVMVTTYVYQMCWKVFRKLIIGIDPRYVPLANLNSV